MRRRWAGERVAGSRSEFSILRGSAEAVGWRRKVRRRVGGRAGAVQVVLAGRVRRATCPPGEAADAGAAAVGPRKSVCDEGQQASASLAPARGAHFDDGSVGCVRPGPTAPLRPAARRPCARPILPMISVRPLVSPSARATGERAGRSGAGWSTACQLLPVDARTRGGRSTGECARAPGVVWPRRLGRERQRTVPPRRPRARRYSVSFRAGSQAAA